MVWKLEFKAQEALHTGDFSITRIKYQTPHSLKKEKFVVAHDFQGFNPCPAGCKGDIQWWEGRWRITAQLTACRKQRARGEAEVKDTLQTGSHLPEVLSALNSSTNMVGYSSELSAHDPISF